MEFTEEEKKVFEVDENEYFDPYCFEKHLLDIYLTDDNEEIEHNMNVTLNFIKKMITEISKKKGYDIVGNESYDTDILLNEIIDVPKEKKDLIASFNPLLYKKPEKLNKYFYSLTKDLSWEDLQYLAESFKWLNDGFRSFFASHLEKLITLSAKLYYELDVPKEDTSFFGTSTSENDDVLEDVNSDTKPDEIAVDPSEFVEWSTNDEWMDMYNVKAPETPSNTIELDKETLIKYVKFINVIEEFIKYRKLGFDIINKLNELIKQRKLEEFYSDEEFSSMFDLIMNHDTTKCSYYFHGTQCLEDAKSIADEGLGMMQDSLSSTSYREFSKDDVILYERGFCGEIGRYAIVIIEAPKNNNGEEQNVVTELQNPSSINFSPSGLQGLTGKPNYIVLPEYIVGYVDKKNKQIVFNPKYRNYEQFSISTHTR